MDNTQKALQTLRIWHRMPAGALLERMQVSRPTLMRAIQALGSQVVSRGRARRTAYAARRAIRGNTNPIPLFRVDEAGRGHEVAMLEAIYPQGCALQFQEEFQWPLQDAMKDGWFEGIPYPLDDMRPQGFLGRNFAHQYAPLLQASEDLLAWDEDDVLHALTILGWDQPGNYILGEPAYRKFLQQTQAGALFLSDYEIGTVYPERAAQALQFGVADSSAAGEFPKFTARRMLNGTPTHVIVKFSGAEASPQEQRWSDLLVCEHLALCAIAEVLNINAAQSRIYQMSNRTFFEVDRFDRHGETGRSGVCTWFSINAALFGFSGKSWLAGANELLGSGLISAEAALNIRRLWHFGRLIANSDMHDGNLAFQPGLALAPAYDMLPMMYAPQRGVELVERTYAPQAPMPGERKEWIPAAEAARAFWLRAAADGRISQRFQRICRENMEKLEKVMVAQHGG